MADLIRIDVATVAEGADLVEALAVRGLPSRLASDLGAPTTPPPDPHDRAPTTPPPDPHDRAPTTPPPDPHDRAPSTPRWRVEIELAREETARLLADVFVALDTWLEDRRRERISVHVGERSYVLGRRTDIALRLTELARERAAATRRVGAPY